MPLALIKSKWVSGALAFFNKTTKATVLTIDSSGIAGNLTGNVTGNLTGNVTGNVTGQAFGSVVTYAADGAIATTVKLALLNGASATVNATLAAGTAGQVIYLKAIDVTNAVTVVPASFRDGTTITFTPANEYAVLVSDGTNWNVVGGDAAIT